MSLAAVFRDGRLRTFARRCRKRTSKNFTNGGVHAYGACGDPLFVSVNQCVAKNTRSGAILAVLYNWKRTRRRQGTAVAPGPLQTIGRVKRCRKSHAGGLPQFPSLLWRWAVD